MTRWDTLKGALQDLFNVETADDFVSMISEYSRCDLCKLKDRCTKLLYEHDRDGKWLRDKDGLLIPDFDFPGCHKVIEDYLTEELPESGSKVMT